MDPLFVEVRKPGGIASASPSNAAHIGGGRSASRGGPCLAFGQRARCPGPVRGADGGHVRPYELVEAAVEDIGVRVQRSANRSLGDVPTDCLSAWIDRWSVARFWLRAQLRVTPGSMTADEGWTELGMVSQTNRLCRQRRIERTFKPSWACGPPSLVFHAGGYPPPAFLPLSQRLRVYSTVASLSASSSTMSSATTSAVRARRAVALSSGSASTSLSARVMTRVRVPSLSIVLTARLS